MSGHFRRFLIVLALPFALGLPGCGSEPSAPHPNGTGGSTVIPEPQPRVIRVPSGQFYGIVHGLLGADPGAKVYFKMQPYVIGEMFVRAKGYLAFGPDEVIALAGAWNIVNSSMRLFGDNWILQGAYVGGTMYGNVKHDGGAAGSWNALETGEDSAMVFLGTGQDERHAAVRFDFYARAGRVSAFLLGDFQEANLVGHYNATTRVVTFQLRDGTAAGSGLLHANGSGQGDFRVEGFGSGTWTGTVR